MLDARFYLFFSRFSLTKDKSLQEDREKPASHIESRLSMTVSHR